MKFLHFFNRCILKKDLIFSFQLIVFLNDLKIGGHLISTKDINQYNEENIDLNKFQVLLIVKLNGPHDRERDINFEENYSQKKVHDRAIHFKILSSPTSGWWDIVSVHSTYCTNHSINRVCSFYPTIDIVCRS